jgi:hypothetical protein
VAKERMKLGSWKNERPSKQLHMKQRPLQRVEVQITWKVEGI